MQLKAPYLLFIGDARDNLSIKMATSIVDWRPELVIGENRLKGCKVTTGQPDISIQQGIISGAQTLVLGLVNSGGKIAQSWVPTILEAIESGMDIVSGLHQRLGSIEPIYTHAKKYNVRLIDIRHPKTTFSTGTGEKRSGKRLLTVGTDCSVGKMYTALAIEKEMKNRAIPTQFRATGQCGILIVGEGVAVDCVVSDFISGATEQLSPENEPDHWDIIEGQGSLFHPAFAGVSLGLLHGAQPDALVLCHAENRQYMRSLNKRSLPSLEKTIEVNLQHAKLTNPDASFVGIAVNTSSMEENEALQCCETYSKQFNLPCVDPFRHGATQLVDALL